MAERKGKGKRILLSTFFFCSQFLVIALKYLHLY